MGLKDQPTVEPYGLEPDFERQLVVACCHRPKLFGRLGYALAPAQLASQACRVMLEAAQAIARECGHGPLSALHVLQRLRRHHTSGLVSWELLQEAADVCDAVDDMGAMDDEDIISEMTPIVQESLRRRAIREGVQAYGNKRDLSNIIALEQLAQRVGIADTSIGVRLGDGAKQEIADYLALQRLPTGILEFDILLDGGLQRQGLGMLIGDSGSGKSLGLSQFTTYACGQGILSCYASLELPRPMALARMLADMTNVPINTLLHDPKAFDKALGILRNLRIPSPVVQRFSSNGTSVPDLVAWLDSVEQHVGEKVGLLTVDYGDKLMAPKVDGRERGSYDAGKVNWEGMKDCAECRNMWVWTASQAKGDDGKRSSKVIKQGAACDSRWKPRIADLVATINPDEDRSFINLYIDKHRSGQSGIGTGPVPSDYQYGRLVSSAVEAGL